MTPTTEAGSSLQELRSFTAQMRQELDLQTRELNEVAMLIKQTATEIDRLAPQRNEATKRLREVEGSLERLSTADIRKVYGAAQEAQMRLFMMQSRLEQLEYKQRALERSQRHLERFVSLVESVPEDMGRSFPQPIADSSPQAVAARAILAQEDELHRVSRQIHDRAAQAISNLVLRVQICERLTEKDDPRGRDELRKLRDALASSLQEVRRLIYELRPLVLDDLGLFPTVRKYAQTVVQMVGDHSAPQVEVLLSGAEQRFDSHVEVATFRLIQEAVGNALRHAQASRVRVALANQDGRLQCTVEDDGVGFDVGAVLAAASQRKALGIATMLDRAATLGAAVSFDSAPGRGTRVRIDVPTAQT